MADDSSKPLSYIDTQGMGGPANPNYDPKKDKQEYKPAIVQPRRLFTPQMVKELKIILMIFQIIYLSQIGLYLKLQLNLEKTSLD